MGSEKLCLNVAALYGAGMGLAGCGAVCGKRLVLWRHAAKLRQHDAGVVQPRKA